MNLLWATTGYMLATLAQQYAYDGLKAKLTWELQGTTGTALQWGIPTATFLAATLLPFNKHARLGAQISSGVNVLTTWQTTRGLPPGPGGTLPPGTDNPDEPWSIYPNLPGTA